MLGYGMSADGGHITQPDKNGTGAAHAMALAVRDARIDPDGNRLHQRPRHQHPLGDQAETTAIKSVFKDHAYKLSVSSTKSQLGHLLGRQRRRGVDFLHPGAARRPDPADDQLRDARSGLRSGLHAQPGPAAELIAVAMSNSFGFGGHNGSLVAGTLRNGRA